MIICFCNLRCRVGGVAIVTVLPELPSCGCSQVKTGRQPCFVSGTDRISFTGRLQTSVFWLHYRQKISPQIAVLRIMIAPKGTETGPLLFLRECHLLSACRIWQTFLLTFQTCIINTSAGCAVLLLLSRIKDANELVLVNLVSLQMPNSLPVFAQVLPPLHHTYCYGNGHPIHSRVLMKPAGESQISPSTLAESEFQLKPFFVRSNRLFSNRICLNVAQKEVVKGQWRRPSCSGNQEIWIW